MKNLVKFGFLGLALTIGFSACQNSAEKKEETTADTTVTVEPTTELDTTTVVTDTTITTDTIKNAQ